MRLITNFLVLFIGTCLAYVPPPYQWKPKYYHGMPVDHFSYSDDDHTFDMRYLINDTFWDSKGGPIFFYCGNEGDIEMFANNTVRGFMWDLAPDFKALVVFAEHRFYGKTQPYGNKSYDMPYLGKLSSEQALADFAVFLTWLKETTPGAENSPVIAFGGSYGGMLAAWMRIKYPHVIEGAIASSAPILQFNNYAPCWTFSAIVTNSFKTAVPGCEKMVNKSWAAFRQKAKTEEGRNWLNQNFRLCDNSLIKSEDNVSLLINWVVDAWGSLAMINYPYPTNFLEPVPGWPVKEACKQIVDTAGTGQDDDLLLLGIYNGISVFHNNSGQRQCFQFADTSSGGLGDDGWGFQACTEMTMPMCNNGTDMFEVQPWNFTAYADACYAQYGVRSRLDWATTNYGGNKLKYASNIVFSNGLLDPWYGGGVLYSITDTVVAILIKDSAHHYDLRGKHPLDTTFIKEARQLEVGFIRKWIEKYRWVKSNRTEK